MAAPKLLILCARADEALRAELVVHLKLLIDHKRIQIERVLPGEDPGEELRAKLQRDKASEDQRLLVVLLLSAALWNEDWWEALQADLQEHSDLMPVLARNHSYKGTWLDKREVIRFTGGAICSEPDRDGAWTTVVEEIERLAAPPAVVKEIQRRASPTGPRAVTLVLVVLLLVALSLRPLPDPRSLPLPPPPPMRVVAIDAGASPLASASAPAPPRARSAPPRYCRDVRTALDMQHEQPSSTWPREKLDSLARAAGLPVQRLLASCQK